MEKIRLTKAEKAVLREIAKAPFTKPEHKDSGWIRALDTLDINGLVKSTVLKTTVMSAELTRKGHAYLRSNPTLRNPIPWDKILALATFIAAVAALFVGCIRLMATTLH